MAAFQLHPVDTLFFRDARPMHAGAGSGGHGANWPLPTILHSGLRASLLRESGETVKGRPIAHHKKGANGPRPVRYVATDSFRSLRTKGPFPMRGNQMYFPCPGDVAVNERDLVSYMNPIAEDMNSGHNSLPADWLKPVVSSTAPRKAQGSAWVSREWLDQYLALADQLEMPSCSEYDLLYHAEPRIGIGLSREVRGQVQEGQLYASEHMRLQPDVRLWFQATLSSRNGEDKHNHRELSACLDTCFTLGGESRMVRVEQAAIDHIDLPKPKGCLIKWVLLSHAVFLHGWRPDWVAEEDGRILLPGGDTTRLEGETRKAWRERIRSLPPVKARLVGACVSKPVYFSGWDTQGAKQVGDTWKPGPKATTAAVPAGSVYYFEAQNEEAAQQLVDALHLRTRSDHLGEKGMGLGVCGIWNYATR